MSGIHSTALSDRETRRTKIIVEFALLSGRMKEAQLEGVAVYNDGKDMIPLIAKFELERRKTLSL